jgi:hypothetical protein
MAFAVSRPARHSLRCLTTRQASLPLRTVQLLPLQGLSTLGSSPARFQARPPACYRAPWRLPGPDFHRQATTSFRSGHDRWTITSMISGRTCCRTTGTRLVAAGSGLTDRADRGGDSAEGGAAVVGEPQRSVRAGCVACGITDAGAGVGRHLLPRFGDPPDGIVPGVVILLPCYSSWQYLS